MKLEVRNFTKRKSLEVLLQKRYIEGKKYLSQLSRQ